MLTNCARLRQEHMCKAGPAASLLSWWVWASSGSWLLLASSNLTTQKRLGKLLNFLSKQESVGAKIFWVFWISTNVSVRRGKEDQSNMYERTLPIKQSQTEWSKHKMNLSALPLGSRVKSPKISTWRQVDHNHSRPPRGKSCVQEQRHTQDSWVNTHLLNTQHYWVKRAVCLTNGRNNIANGFFQGPFPVWSSEKQG